MQVPQNENLEQVDCQTDRVSGMEIGRISTNENLLVKSFEIIKKNKDEGKQNSEKQKKVYPKIAINNSGIFCEGEDGS